MLVDLAEMQETLVIGMVNRRIINLTDIYSHSKTIIVKTEIASV